MTGIIFPNVAGTLAPLMQMRRQEEQNAFEMGRARRADEAAAKEDEAGQYFPAAVKGDPEAVAKVMASPKHALPLMTYLDKADERTRTRLKEGSAWTGQAAMAILSAPPEQRAAAYAAALEDGRARGFDLKGMPPQYSPDLDGKLNFYANQARDINKYFEEQANRPQVMGQPPGAGGGAPVSTSPDVKAKGGEYMSYLQTKHGLSPVAAAGVVGGLVQESGLDPTYAFTRPGGDNGSAHGMAQWRLERADGLKKFAQAQGKAPTDPTLQLDFLVNEMKGGDMGAQRAYAMLQQAKTPEEATTAMMHFFRPAGYTPNNPQAGHGYAQRVQYSQQFAPGSGTGAPPGMAVGDAAPRADASGTPLPPATPADLGPFVTDLNVLRQNGYAPAGHKGVQMKGPTGGYLYIHPETRQTIEYKPKDPNAEPLSPGYRWKDGGRAGQEFVPGGPADPVQAGALADAKRRAEEKAIPQVVTKGLQENVNNLKQIDRALAAIDKNPGSIGGVGSTIASVVPGVGGLQNRFGDPEGTDLRAQIANIGSLVIHDRSGAAVTASETPRLMPFIPLVSDSAEVARKKLANFKANYEQMLRDTLSYYGADTGFKPYTPAIDYLNGSAQPPQGATPQAPPAQPPAQAPQAVSEGATATNPQTGERVIFSGGQWRPTR